MTTTSLQSPPKRLRADWWGSKATKGVTKHPYRRRSKEFLGCAADRPGDFDPLPWSNLRSSFRFCLSLSLFASLFLFPSLLTPFSRQPLPLLLVLTLSLSLSVVRLCLAAFLDHGPSSFSHLYVCIEGQVGHSRWLGPDTISSTRFLDR